MILARIANRRGTSLIEIMTTLVILVVGILSVARMFSGGFVVLKRGENATIASRLAEGEFERLRARSQTLPLGITEADSSPAGPADDANAPNIRKIIGETVKIPAPVLAAGTSGAIVGAVHELAFAPVSSVDSVYSASLQRRVEDSGDADQEPWNWLRSTQYAIDYDEAKICFRSASYDRTFSITYSYWIENDDGRRLMTVTGEDLFVPADAGWVEITAGGSPVTQIQDFSHIEDRSDSASRAFQLLASGADWSNYDPYQYRVVDSLTGRLAFNPRGYGYKEVTPNGIQDLTAHIDYTVYDWSILSDTVQVPDHAPYRVRTTLKNIKQVGVTINDDGSPYAGLTPTFNEDMLIVDMATGQYIPLSSGLSLDHENGILILPEQLAIGGAPVTVAGRSLRIYYRAVGDWQVQVRKAYERYTPQNNAAVSFREYFHNQGNDRIILNKSEIGKTVSVDYAYLDGDGVERIVIGEVVHAIANASGDRAWVITRHAPEYIRAMRGVSFMVRVLWSETSKRNSDGRIVPKFQHYDLDGELTRSLSTG